MFPWVITQPTTPHTAAAGARARQTSLCAACGQRHLRTVDTVGLRKAYGPRAGSTSPLEPGNHALSPYCHPLRRTSRARSRWQQTHLFACTEAIEVGNNSTDPAIVEFDQVHSVRSKVTVCWRKTWRIKAPRQGAGRLPMYGVPMFCTAIWMADLEREIGNCSHQRFAPSANINFVFCRTGHCWIVPVHVVS